MVDRKLILPTELKVCATCAYWDGVRSVDEDVRVVVVCESCQGECLVREALTPPLDPAEEDCLWDEIIDDDAGHPEMSRGGSNMGLIPPGSEPPLTVTPEDTVFQAARAMTARHVGAATVLDGARVVGVVTERDVLQKVVAGGLDPAKARVRDVMSSPAVSIRVNASVASAAELMRKHHIRHLVVVDESEALVGMLALRYVLYDLMDDLERKVGDLVGYIMVDGPGG
jgi:CBS domain-containing protein